MYEELLRRADKNSIEMLESLRILFEDSKKPKIFNCIKNCEEDDDEEEDESEEDLFLQIKLDECKYTSDCEDAYVHAENDVGIISDFDEEDLQEDLQEDEQEDGNESIEEIYIEDDEEV